MKRSAPNRLLASALAAALATAALPAAAQAAYAPAAVVEAMKDAGGDRDVRAFYKARNYRPLWIEGFRLGRQADRLLDLVASAELDGLDPDDYRPRALAEAIDRAWSGSPRDLARAEMLLSATFAEYVRDARRPRDIGMHYVDKELAPLRPPERSVLEAAGAAPSLDRYLAEIGWMHPLYADLRRALAQTAGGRRGDPQVFIAPGPILRPGATGERVSLLRERLGLDPQGGYDADLEDAVRAAQAAHGLPQDGRAGPRTLAALNRGAGAGAGREDLLRINLERARALPGKPPRRYILVDAASARLWMYEDGRVRDSMKVIVGKPSEQTPMMAGLIRFAQVNPYWNIPPDLVPRRIAQPILARGPGAIAGRYEVLSDWTDEARTVEPGEIDWRAVAEGRREVRVRQLPGGDNAMGRVKFMFPNKLGIYLHDTPEKNLFAKADRRFSSGCVRLEDAERLGRWLFDRPLSIPAKGRERQVDLPEPVPVYITYFTAMPEAGRIAYRADPYGRDAVQLAQLQPRLRAGR